MKQETDVPLLQAIILMQSVVFSCIDRKSFPFTRTQIYIFTMLAMEGELTMKQIAHYISSSQEQATRAVAPLADAGYVERRTDQANRTRVYIRLTEAGTALLKEQSALLKDNLSDMLSAGLSAEEMDALFNSCSELVRLMEKVKFPEGKKSKTKKQENQFLLNQPC